ncbi:MAG: DEAD/DEAH box helicase [Patescibacteria group bacterium]
MQNTRNANRFSRNKFRSTSSSSFRPQNRNRNVSKKFRGEAIDPSRFIKKAVNTPETMIEITNAFADFDLVPELQVNLKKRNYKTPTPIQDQAIKPILDGRDLIGLANTGTGKTAAFLLPLINKVFKKKSERVLIIAPTRELAQQIETEFREFSWSMKIFSTACVGGLPIYKQMSMLRSNPGFVIGTPGRLKDLSERGAIKFSSFSNIVLDEVDRMLDMGFVEEITNILNQLPENKQSLFFSATMPVKIKDLVRLFMKDPVIVEVKSAETAANVDQDIVKFRGQDGKFNQLKDLLSKPELKKVLIFSETKRDVERLTEDLIRKGFSAESIHGDKKQHQRQRALLGFRNNAINILIATDVAARGLDIKDVTHVINYTVPQTYNDYVHRIGRTGRGDAKGMALTFIEA